MTGTPGATGPTGPGPVRGYYVEWSGATAGSGEENTTLPDDGGDVGATGPEDRFPDEFNWPSVEVNFGDPVTEYKEEITGVVKGYRLSQSPQGEEIFTPVDVDYELTKFTIESCNIGASSSGSCADVEGWEDEEFDDRYGGVFLYAEDTPVDKNAGQSFTGGTRGGKVDDVDSGYIYVLVFNKSEFEYYKLNSNKSEGKFKDTFDNSEFSTTPVYKNVKDEFDKAAPIYPMDSIIKFLPDDREKVFIKYTVKVEAKVDNQSVSLENGEITITHPVTQDTGSYPDKLQELLKYCNFNNPGNIDREDFSLNYPTNYPYTIISESKPTKRMTDGEEDGDLKKGDLWYNPSEDERRYYSGVDAPDDVEIEDPGRNYEDADDVQTSLIPPEEEECNPRDPEDYPYGLKVDIKTDSKGRITSASISEENYPIVSNFSDGDIVAVQGGNGQAKLKVIIDDDKDRWIKTYVTEEF